MKKFDELIKCKGCGRYNWHEYRRCSWCGRILPLESNMNVTALIVLVSIASLISVAWIASQL